MVSINAALKLIRENIEPGRGELIPLRQTLGRALIEDVKAAASFPPFSCSAFDGYAVQAEELRGASLSVPIKLPVEGLVVAGRDPEFANKSGHAVRIMTGAQLPFGTDSVLKQEEVDSEDGQALFKRPAKKGEGVRLQGGDAREGEKVFSRRTILDAEKIGLLVSLGVTEVNVYSPPKVAFFMIGDELVPPGDPLPPGKIWAGNSYMFQALVLKYGALPVDGGIVPDTEESIADAMLSVTDARIILTAGGSGKGVHDLTGRAFESVGGQFLFQGVDIWPGGTLSMGLLNGVPYFLLPGGPRTGSLCFHVFVHEALQVIYPTERGRSLHLRATMLDSLRGRSGVTNYLYVTLLRGEKENLAVRSGKSPSQQGVQALAVIPPEADSVKRGDVVEVILL